MRNAAARANGSNARVLGTAKPAARIIWKRATHPIASVRRAEEKRELSIAAFLTRRKAGTNELSLKRILLREGREREGSYIWSLPVVRHVREIVLQSPVTFFCGENGTGKSTLLEVLAVHCGFNAEDDTKILAILRI